jgi:HEPN domain-containing protein/predicted nucleotidyltransferase
MKKSLAHLPKRKHYELALVRDTILEKFSDVQMIILFGSYARDTWVEEKYTKGHITYEYKSDFDILVITESKKQANNISGQHRIEDFIENNEKIETPVSIIYHHITLVNQRLVEGQYFFSDIKKEGILLYDSKKFKLERRRKLDPTKRKQIAEDDFKYWFKMAKEFYGLYKAALEKRWYKRGAFLLHQATEHAYTAILLVFRGYKPKVHNIKTLGRRAGSCDPQFLTVFPKGTAEQKRMFKLLQKAYVDARYKPSYRITRNELEYLAKRVKMLQKLTKKICTMKIDSFI